MYYLLFIILTLVNSINIKSDPSKGENKVDYPEDVIIQTIDKIVLPKKHLLWISKTNTDCIEEKKLLASIPAESVYHFEFSDIFCYDESDLSNLLSNIDENIQGIEIKNELDNLQIDLNNLNHKIQVTISGIEDNSGDTGPDEEETDLKLLSKIKKNKKLIRTSSSQKLQLVGNIKQKVYNLEIMNLDLEIINSPLNINSLTLNSCSINANSKNIECTRLIIDPFTHMSIIKNQQYDKIHVGQFTVIDAQNLIKPCYYINYYKDYCEIGVREYENENDDSQKNIYNGLTLNEESFECKIPYSCCEMVGLLAISHFFHFTYQIYCTEAKTINITIFKSEIKYEDQNQAGFLLADEKYKVYISSVDNWDDKIDGKTTVYLTGFLNCLDIDISMLHKNIEVNKFSHYLESGFDPDKETDSDNSDQELDQSKESDSDNELDQSKESDSVIVTPDVSTDEDDESIDINEIEGNIEYNKNDINNFINEIKSKFSGNDIKENITNVLSVTLPTNEDTYEFNNLDLLENQYLKLKEGSKVNLNGGNLNVIFDKNSIPSIINIAENNNDNVNLSIMNLNEATITINSLSNGEKKDIHIKSKSILHNLLKVNAGQNVKSIIFDSIVLRKSGRIENDNKEVILTVHNLFVDSKSESEINSIEIDSNLNVSQTSHLTVTDSKIEKASINIFLSSFDVADYDKKPIITGNFIDEPKNVNLFNSIQKVGVKENVNYLLIEGKFTSCSNWTNKISFGNTEFNNGFCSEVNSLNSGDEKQIEFLFVKKVQNNHPDEKKKGLSNGAIAGIVIGCVVAVAIIVVVVVILVKKKKNGVNNATSEGN